ncbi:sigma factor-like helix-turn-helix DNA-binding protein [Tepidibacter formicigenes]|uniref:Sigma-70, region 4 n=1 Tax=Tepidibacter formicigenes DSM 15518 TaxID=1123349 RepID=A0A1M6RK30_9FIRM|nr:sigma factor-like helix-turn-helix DNA-binding protein [Tepidibacter formicigenes]SHK32813.1 Sigma-70, region 4 [Tepidibacter formicigenes DSM 15518]
MLQEQSIFIKLKGFNQLIEDSLKKKIKISDILEHNDFTQEEIAILKSEKLKQFLDLIIFGLKCSLIGSFTGNRQAEILVKRYGLDGGRVLTLQQMGDEFGVSKERVRQLQEKMLKKLTPTKTRHILEEIIVLTACNVLEKEYSPNLRDKENNEL